MGAGAVSEEFWLTMQATYAYVACTIEMAQKISTDIQISLSSLSLAWNLEFTVSSAFCDDHLYTMTVAENKVSSWIEWKVF